MVLAYFKRGQFKLREYTRTNFFVGLYLANDMEEDEEELKYEIFPWLLGDRWRKTYPRFLQKRDQLLRRIDYRALVSRRCCEEVMKLCPDHYVWQRERESHHGGAIRKYAADSEEYYPRGPSHSPRFCQDCDIRMAEMVLDDDSSADNKVDTFYWIRTEE
ncbi:PREDICTED: speedy protein A-like [Priapulus caudatus]|uniref:Speedy protein A-like n=1 Tax=Priapulus caudatus TaxID=37621 RepID=A0ABM1ELL7_PRICU|nr:PREDICTED: speedy protein A-like [Priapulus caudatus]